MIVVKDEKGIILARSILRLLLDDQHKPVLFLERIYPSYLEAAKTEAILKIARRKSKEMNIPLLHKEIGHSQAYNGSIHSLSSPAPFEYVDAQGGIKRDGVYTITQLMVLA